MRVSKGFRSFLVAVVALTATPAFAQTTATTLTVTVEPVVHGSGASQVSGVLVGTTNDYVVTITNTGTVDATDVVITATLPEGLVFSRLAECADPTSLPCTLAGPIAPGATEAAEITLTVKAPLPATPTCLPAEGVAMGNTTITADAANADPVSASAANTMNRYTDIETVTMTGPDSVDSGGTYALDATVRNNGPCPVAAPDEVLASFSIPPSFQIVSATGPCTVTQVEDDECSLGALAVDEEKALSLTVRAPDYSDDLVRASHVFEFTASPAVLHEAKSANNGGDYTAMYDQGSGCSSGGAGALLSLLPLLAAGARRRRKHA